MKHPYSIAKDIKDLKVQGAENIARAAILALRETALTSQAITKTKFLDDISKIKRQLLSSRPTEPCMRNSLNFITHSVEGNTPEELKNSIIKKIDMAISHLDESIDIISGIAAKKIRNGSIIFTHCHSSTVSAALKKARKQGKRFEVHNTETRPMLQGRITARELLDAGIPVTMYPDSAVRQALKKADLFLLGADAITSEGKIINKIGSELFAEASAKQGTPLYVCADSWKFDAKTVFGYEEDLEKRSPSEVWRNKPKHLKICNLAFEKIDPDLVTGIISEFGVYKPEVFVEEVRRNSPWIFK